VSNLFVSASQHEGFGLVFLEAMAFGLPIVCYNRGGQTDFLFDGQTGKVVPLNDTGQFVGAIRALHADRPLRYECGRHNRTKVEQYFIDTCAARYESVLERAIDRTERLRERQAGIA
jgi:glycosyltransferase involved in cell wall biosynthesis